MSLRTLTSRPSELLGRHVGRRARAHVLSRERVGEPGEPEVREAHLALPVQHHVGGLQVAVQQALRVRGRQPLGDLAADVGRLVEGEAADAPQQRRQVLAVHELHREEVLSFRLADVPHAADRGVRHLPRRAHLRVEPLEPVRVAFEGARQELEGDRLLELQVVRAIDLAHSAPAEQPHDPVAPGEDRARNEAIARRRAPSPRVAGSGAGVAAPSPWGCRAAPGPSRRPDSSVGTRPSASRRRDRHSSGAPGSRNYTSLVSKLHHAERLSGDRIPDTGRAPAP